MRNEGLENKVCLAVGTDMVGGKIIVHEEDDEVSYTRVGRFGVKGD